MIKLTEEQIRVLKQIAVSSETPLIGVEFTEDQASVLKQGYPVRIPAPQVGGDLIVVLAEAHENTESVLQETLDDLREKAALSRARPKGRDFLDQGEPVLTKLRNCVSFQKGEFGLPDDCVAQCEAIYALEKREIDTSTGTIGTLDEMRMRDLIKAIGFVIDSDCEPNESIMHRHALVTGASSGLGRELVRQLVRDRGMTVLATARRQDRLEALAAESSPGRVLIAPGDLADPVFRDRLWDQAEALPGGLDLLINNAGLGDYSEFATQDPAAIRRIVEVNLMALFDLTQKAVRHMRARSGGEIVEVSSVLGFVGLPYSAVYVASKHAVNGLVKTLRCELRGTGVRVWAACPGRTESEFAERAMGVAELKGPVPRGAATGRVVRGIVRGLGGRRAFLFPNAAPWAVVTLAHWVPGPFDWFMERWSARFFGAEINRARHGEGPNPSAP